jgi:glycerophosphoryl diester phosphodiesterase
MKFILIFLFIFFFLYIKCQDFSKLLSELNTDFLSRIDKTAQNINTDTIQYGLSYDNKSVVKAFIKLADDGIKNKIKFVGFLRTESGKNEYELNCSNPTNDLIECYSKPGIKLDTNDRYYLYYNRSRKEKIIFDYENILEDDKRINLIFQPELYVNQTVYLDNKKVMAQINKKTVGEAYLYIINQTKKVLNNPKDRFNKYEKLNNYVFQPELKGYKHKNTSDMYKEAIRRGFLMVEAEVQFTNDKVPVIYYKNKKIFKKDFNDLKKHETVLTLLEFLKLCKEKDVIAELKFTNFEIKDYSYDIDVYAKILLEDIRKADMINSVFIYDDLKVELFLQLLQLKNDIAVSVYNIKTKEDIKQIKDKYKKCKRVIYNLDIKDIDKEIVKYILSIGGKVKASLVDNYDLAKKLQKMGANYLTTNNLPPFLIKNEYDVPFRVKCLNIFLDDLAECKMGKEIRLRDNEKYNIHYSLNIYNKSEEINETAIGEFRYEDTKINDNKYYIIKLFDFKRGVIQLITSDKVEKGKHLYGVIGPKYDNVAEIYQFHFTCDGTNQHYIGCEIEKDSDKIEYDGEYIIYYIENYSYNEEEIEDWGLTKLKTKHIYSKKERTTYTLLVLMVSIVFLIISYIFQGQRDINVFGESNQKSVHYFPRKLNYLIDADGKTLI